MIRQLIDFTIVPGASDAFNGSNIDVAEENASTIAPLTLVRQLASSRLARDDLR